MRRKLSIPEKTSALLKSPHMAGFHALGFLFLFMGALFGGLKYAQDRNAKAAAEATKTIAPQFNLQALAVPEEFSEMADGFYVWPNQKIDGEEKDCIVQLQKRQIISLDCN